MPSRQVTASNHAVLSDIATSLSESSRILLITGAGISTNCGIPDFRSKGGLYARKLGNTVKDLSSRTMNASEAAAAIQAIPTSQRATKIFDLFQSAITRQNTSTLTAFNILIVLLNKFAKTIQPKREGTHMFIKELRDTGRLLRCYTQNIDALEAQVGLSLEVEIDTPILYQRDDTVHSKVLTEVAPLHGTISTVRCRICAATFTWQDEFESIYFTGHEPSCPNCEEYSKSRSARMKRAPNVGNLRPNIVLYGESHPQQTVVDSLIEHDAQSKPEVLLIMGTSMSTRGIQQLVKTFAHAVHQTPTGRVICINRSPRVVAGLSNSIDIFVNMDCDDWVQDVRLRRNDILDSVSRNRLSVPTPTTTTPNLLTREEEEEEALRWLEAFF